MKLLKRFLILLALAAPSIGVAQPISERHVSLAPGTSGTTIGSRNEGTRISDRLLEARAHQAMKMDLAPENLTAWSNVMQGTDPAAIFIGSSSVNSVPGALPADGD